MLSDNQKKQGVVSKLPGGPLPGLGGNPSVGPLPGLGGRPAGALPGLGGKPGAGALPGMKPSGSVLPGMKPGAAPTQSAPAAVQAPVVPPFLQPKKPQAGAQQQAVEARAAAMEAEQRIIDALVQSSARATIPPTEKNAKKTVIYGAVIASVIGMGIGVVYGMGLTARQQLNGTIRDALVVEYELKETGKVFNEIEGAISVALSKANKGEFDNTHLGFLKSGVAGNPLPQNLLAERNFKNFNPSAVEMLFDYYRRWDKLYTLTKEHMRSTEYDMKTLKGASGAGDLKAVKYGMVFKRDKEQDNKFVGNVVVMGTTEGKKTQVQLDTSTYGSERDLYNPGGEDIALTKTPAKFVVEVGAESKAGILANATESHFAKYLKRLQEISTLITGMAQLQKELMTLLSTTSGQNASWGVSPNPEEGLQEYIQQSREAGEEEKTKK